MSPVLWSDNLIWTAAGMGFGAYAVWFIAKEVVADRREAKAKKAGAASPTLAPFRTPDTDERLAGLGKQVEALRAERK